MKLQIYVTSEINESKQVRINGQMMATSTYCIP